MAFSRHQVIRLIRTSKGNFVQTKSKLDFNSVQIDCQRLLLVPITQVYSEVIFKEFTDEITRYMIPATPKDIREIDSFIEASIANMEQGNDIILVILDNMTREFLGVCGLHGRPNPNEPMLGIWLKKSAHGNHYGQEAIKYLADWTRKNIVHSHMIYPCDKANIASRKIAEHLGGVVFHEGQTKSMSGNVLNEVAYKVL